MSNQKTKETKEIYYRCIVYVGDSDIKFSYFSEGNRDEIRAMRREPKHDKFLKLLQSVKPSGKKIENCDNEFKGLHKYLDQLIESRFKILTNQGIGYCFVLQDYSLEYKEALRIALDTSGFCTLADANQVLILSDVEAAAFSVARENTEDIMVVSLKNDQVITANVSKQAVKIIGNAEKLNANLLSNLKNEFTSLVQEALRTSRIKTKLPEPSAIDFDAEWEHFKKNSQNFSEDNQGAITFLFKHSLENLITTAQESGKLLQPIKDALNSIEKIDRKGNKLVVLNDLGYFSGYINNKVNILSPKSSQSHETALKVVVEVNECLQSTKKNYDHLCGELWKEQNCGTNYDAVKKEHDRATQEYENAQKRYEEVTKKEKDTWTNSFTVIETDSLMKGVCVACKPMVSDVPASVGERTFGTKEILSLDESDEKIISIDFGTDRSKFVVYEKKDGEWIRVLNDSILSVAYYDDKGNKQCFTGDEALAKYLDPSTNIGNQILQSFKLLLEKIENYENIDYIVKKIANFLKTIYEKANIKPTDENVRFCFSYPSVWSHRATLVMRQAVTVSGIQVDAGNVNKVLMIPEAEAVAIACAESIKAKAKKASLAHDMDIYYLICDLGGGTSDMSVHKVSKNGNNKITQITPDDGIQCGSHLLDKNFIDLARVKCFGQDVSPSPVELARMGHKFATETKINYDGSKKIEFKHDFVVQSKTVTIHVTNEELKEKVFNPVFNEIIDTIKRVIEEADIKPDLIYFSGGLSLAKAFQKEAKHSSFASKLFFKDDGGDWDVVTGAAMFAMDPEIITERAIKRPSFLEAYFCYSNKSDSSVNSKTINGTKYSKNRILDLYDSSSVENNEFFEHQLSLLTEGNDTITLALYNGLPKSEFSELEARLTDDTRISHSHTYHISLADLVLSENKTFKIRTYPGCSVIELIFENAIYRLIGLEAVKVGSPKNETVHYLSTEEHNARQEEKQKARQEEKQQDRGSTKLSRFFSSLLQHDS